MTLLIKEISAGRAECEEKDLATHRAAITSTSDELEGESPDIIELGYNKRGTLQIAIYDEGQRMHAVAFFSPADAEELILALQTMKVHKP